jgi:hypothetical protein
VTLLQTSSPRNGRNFCPAHFVTEFSALWNAQFRQLSGMRTSRVSRLLLMTGVEKGALSSTQTGWPADTSASDNAHYVSLPGRQYCISPPGRQHRQLYFFVDSPCRPDSPGLPPRCRLLFKQSQRLSAKVQSAPGPLLDNLNSPRRGGVIHNRV